MQIEKLADEINALQQSLRKLANDLNDIRNRLRQRDPNDPLLEPITEGPDPYDPD